MKKNLGLFAILIFLLIGTYFFQEKRIEHEHIEESTKDLLIKFKINHLKLSHIEAEKKNEQWWSGGKLLSYNVLKQIEKKLGEITKVKQIKGDWASYSQHPLNFQINHIDWSIGDLSLDKQAFYIRQDKSIFLAVIEGESMQLTRHADEIASIKLHELISLLTKNKEEFLEVQLFRYFPTIPMSKVLLNMDGHLPYELDFEKNQTVPPSIPGISAHHNIKEKFKAMLTQVNIRDEIPFSDNLKFKKIGDIVFKDNKRSVKWELWLESDKSADAIIIEPIQKKAFLMVGGTLKIFFVQLQEYWDKKVIPQKDFESFQRLKLTFSQGNKKANIVLVNKEPMEFESRKFKINNDKMEKLIQIILNLGPNDQASRVSILSSSEKKQLLSGDHLRLEVMGQELILWRKTEELIVVNITRGFKAHFIMLDESFRGNFQDMIN
jgi:hypothetical protein